MPTSNEPPGPATDAHGHRGLDPTTNVRAMLKSAIKRQDDLRAADSKATARLVHVQTKHLRDTASLRSRHYRELRVAEAGRIDAIMLNVADTAKLTSAAAEIRATTLANQVTTSADTLRNQVADAAQASNDTLDRRFDPIQKSIEEIRRFQFETQGGKAGIVETRAAEADMKPILDAIAELTKAQYAATVVKGEHRASVAQMIALAALGTTLFGGVLGALILKAVGS